MKVFYVNTCRILLCFLTGHSLHAQEDTSFVHAIKKTVVSLHISTLGFGGNISFSLPSRAELVSEIGYTYFKFARNQYFSLPEQSEILLQPDIEHSILTSMITWYPFKKRLIYLKSGIGYALKQTYFVRITSPTGLMLGGMEISEQDFGQIDLNINWNRLMPYAGMGIGRKDTRKRADIAFNIGFFYMGSPKIKARFEGFLESTTLDTEMVKIQKNLKNYSYLPVLSINLRYKIK